MNSGVPGPGEVPLVFLSWSVLLSLLIGLGIIFIGIREFFQPSVGASQFGVPLLDAGDGDFLAIKAARDVASGVLLFALLALADRNCVTWAMLALTLIPIFDGLIVFRHAKWVFMPAIWIHWGTAAVMLVIAGLLRAGK